MHYTSIIADFDDTMYNTAVFKKDYGITNGPYTHLRFAHGELRRYLYRDVEGTLAWLRRTGVRIVILTYAKSGNIDWQRDKVRASGIEKYVDEIACVDVPKGQWWSANKRRLINGSPAVFVDDSPEQIASMTSVDPSVLCVLADYNNIHPNTHQRIEVFGGIRRFFSR